MVKVHQLSPHYDDVLRDVSARINASGSVGKGDIATLAFWKRIRTEPWAEDFLSLPELEVRGVTTDVVVAARERLSDVLGSSNRDQACQPSYL